MGKVIGIDLGTTNSCVAVMEGGKPVVIPNAEGARTTPSVVAFTKSGERLVGEVAKRQAITNSENTIYSIKRFMGRKYDDAEVNRDKQNMPFKVVRADNGDAWVEVMGKKYSPPEISAMILQKLKADAEAYLGEHVTQAVITVPAYFNDSQRNATKDAGRIAGLEVLRIINEPTAASLAYGLGKGRDERIAVYDLGGGTFNISLLELGEGVFEVKSTNGDTHLGGDDLDQRVINWLADEFRKEQGIDLRQDRMALQRLKEAAEKAKKELSSSMQAEINLPFIASVESELKHLMMSLSRSKLEQLVEDLVKRTHQPVIQALNDAGMRPSQINKVLLIGGQTRMPMVQELVKQIFDKNPNKEILFDEVVAIGAALQAGILTGEGRDEVKLLLDVTPFSLGVEARGGSFTRLIERNTTIPTQKSRIFSTDSDNQASFEVHILQGERELAKDNRSLGRIILDGLPPAPRGIPQIEVTFDIDANGIVSVHAKDKGTGREQRITIHAPSGLSEDEVDSMVFDAEAHVSEDKRRREEIKLRNRADSEKDSVEKTLRELGDQISPGERREVESRISDMRAALATDDLSRIQGAREALQQSFYKIRWMTSNQAYTVTRNTGESQEEIQASSHEPKQPEQTVDQSRPEKMASRAQLHYLDFDLEITHDAGRDYRVIARTPIGDTEAKMSFPYDDLALEHRLTKLRIALLRPRELRRRLPTLEEQAIQDFGEELFNALITGDVRQHYIDSRDYSRQQGKGLRLRLRILTPQLAALPWEYLYDPHEAEYICLSGTTPVVRALDLPRPSELLIVEPPLRILGMIADPIDQERLDIARERMRVEHALTNLIRAKLVELIWWPGQTWRDLQKAMWAGPWHVFHFIGHGGFDTAADEGVLALANEEGHSHLLHATQVGRLLANYPQLRLVILNACNGATGGQRDLFSSTAAMVARRGIPAVLAMQEEISDNAAIELTRTFYGALAHGLPVDAAVSEARTAISVGIQHSLEWGAPVLYLRTPDGVLFHLPKKTGPK